MVCFEQDDSNFNGEGKSRKAANALNVSVIYEMHKDLSRGILWRSRVTTWMRLLSTLDEVASSTSSER